MRPYPDVCRCRDSRHLMGRWSEIVLDRARTTQRPIMRSDLKVQPDFAARVSALLRPGATVVVTDAPLADHDAVHAVLEAQSEK